MNWYIAVIKKYIVFNGRARRKEYWYFFVFNLLIAYALSLADMFTGTLEPDSGYGLLSGFYSLAIFIPSIAVIVRRLHDTNRSGWWLLIVLIPIIGAITLLVFCILDSDPNENQYGMNPKLDSALF